MIFQSEAPTPEEIEVHKHRRYKPSYTSYLSSATGETGLTGGKGVSVTPEKRIPKKKKNIKSKALSPFISGNKTLLKEENDHNSETTDTSLSGKDDMSRTSPDDFIKKTKDKKTNDDDEYKEETSKLQYGKKSVDNSETLDNLRDDSIINTSKEEEVLIQRLMTMNFEYHVIQSVIDIVSLCEGKDDRIVKKNPAKDKW